jgi:hypothetical protein
LGVLVVFQGMVIDLEVSEVHHGVIQQPLKMALQLLWAVGVVGVVVAYNQQ